MRALLIAYIITLPLYYACTGNDKGAASSSENDVDAARNFIRAALDGQYSDAKTMILPDSVNQQYLEAFATNYRERMNGEDKRGYRESSINIHDIRQLGDSATIIHYSNSYKKKRDSLKVIRNQNNWLVDLKYSFTPTDSLR